MKSMQRHILDKKHANLSTILQTIVPLFFAIFYLFSNKSYFDINSAIAAIIPLSLPLLIRNFTNVNTNVDYSMITISNIILLCNFIFKMYSETSYIRCFNLLLTQHKEVCILIGFSALLDLLLCIFADRVFKVFLKTLYSISLCYIMKTYLNMDYHVIGFVMLFLILPIYLLMIIGESDNKICMMTTIALLYAAMFTGYIEVNSESFRQSRLEKYYDYVNRVIDFVPWF